MTTRAARNCNARRNAIARIANMTEQQRDEEYARNHPAPAGTTFKEYPKVVYNAAGEITGVQFDPSLNDAELEASKQELYARLRQVAESDDRAEVEAQRWNA